MLVTDEQIDELLSAMDRGEDPGICQACGEFQPAEPDAVNNYCEACGAQAVVGTEAILLSL